ncbi:HAMP domain-containing sensor histidine kinase [Longimycelium tulufanense]|uniref:HAMP domain-containing sensor histidine kinase n=1 Tax=Longimycelium tulufanense TaxID=907463 RepID=UPI001E388322|nr:HAMP domain-containing sensor histidine kinase [Longimycelium tulufanense]
MAAAVVSVSLAGMAVAAYLLVAHQLDRELDRGLSREVTRVKRIEQRDPDSWGPSGPCLVLAAPACVQKVAADGKVLGGDDSLRLPILPGTREVAAGSRDAYFSDVDVEGYRLRVLTAPLSQGRAVQVAVRADTVDDSLDRIRTGLVVAGLVGVGVAALGGHLVARTGLSPVARLTATAERVAATRDPSHRIDLGGRDELARLAGSFNTMLGELQEALDARDRSLVTQRRLVADASHELRTPLTSLRTNIDLLARADRLTPEQRAEVTGALRAQVRELADLVADLVDLARGDDPQAPAEPVDDVRLDELVEHCVESARRHWPAVTFETALEPTVVDGQPRRLTRAVRNLLDNAAKFSPAAGIVRGELSGRELRVRDHGPGIPAEDLPHVFDRFYRATSARGLPGSGLGLAIVAQVAEAHRAVVRAEPAEGGGTVVRLRFHW